MKYLIPFISLFLLIGCLNDSDPFGDPVDQTDYLEEYATQEGVVQTNSGLLYKILEEGDGNNPSPENVVFIEYKSKLIDGTPKFTTNGELDYLYLEQFANIAPGLLEGIQLMKEGARYEFVLPAELAPSGSARPGSVYIFDVFLDSYLRDPGQFLAENAQQEDIEITDSGLQYRIIEEGDEEGDSPSMNSAVRAHYKGYFSNGYVFDSSKGDPALFDNIGGLIDGFTEGLLLMNEGAKYQFFIPPNIGYGSNPQRPDITPPDVALIFDVELVEILN